MKHKRKILGVLLGLAFLLGWGTPVMAAEGGSFVLTATTTNNVIIEPVLVEYESGQTIREALASSGYAFTGLEQDWITTIEGTEGNYNRYYDGGGYDLDVAASTIRAIIFTESSNYEDNLVNLVLAMHEYLVDETNVQNYSAASSAYTKAKNALKKGSGYEDALSALQTAIQEYQDILNGTQYTVTVTAIQDEETLSQPVITMTDSYGNITTATGTSICVVAGEYTFAISDGGINRTEGSLTVEGDTAVSVELPSGEWFGEIILQCYSRGIIYDREDNEAGNGWIYYIPDCMTQGTVNYYAERGKNLPSGAMLYAIYTKTTGADASTVYRSWESNSSALAYLIQEGMEGAIFSMEAHYTDENGYTQIQSRFMEIRRTPSLSSLEVYDEETQMLDGFVTPKTSPLYDYSVDVLGDTLTIEAVPFGDDYTVLINGSSSTEVTFDEDSAEITITVMAEGVSTDYTLWVTKREGVKVTLDIPEETTVYLVNSLGSMITINSQGIYRLIPGETYTYIATKEVYYHSTASFEASAGLTVSVAEPEVVHRLNDLVIYGTGSVTTRSLLFSGFVSTEHFYMWTVDDYRDYLSVQATANDGCTVTAVYRKFTSTSADGTIQNTTITKTVSSTSLGTYLGTALSKGGYSQTDFALRVSSETDGVTQYQNYAMVIGRILHLGSLSLEDGEITFFDEEENAIEFDRDITEYYAKVDSSLEEIVLNASFTSSSIEAYSGGYYAYVNGVFCDDLEAITVPLDVEKENEDIKIEVCHEDSYSVATTYTIHLEKQEPVAVTFDTNPTTAIVFVVRELDNKTITAEEDGSFWLTPGVVYAVSVTCNGYVGQEFDYTASAEEKTKEVTLTKAPESALTLLSNETWPGFRADSYNNGVIDWATPTTAEETVLYWAVQLGDGYSSDAVSCPILVDGFIYVYAGEKIYKVDSLTGEVLAENTMDRKSSFAINNPTYAEGMIFVGLSNGGVQAFDAETLESLWIYNDPLMGQPNCPIVYYDGYIYTGFWLGETSEANYVCLSVTDEDPTNTMESKVATWRYTQLGGFYWAGAYVCDDYLLIGTDDGASGYLIGYGSLLSLNPKTGAVIDSMTMKQVGDIRCSITFEPDSEGSSSGTAYFTSKGGYFYGMKINADGTFDSLRYIKLYNYADDDSSPAMSTSTPTIYNGRAYIGVSGTGQFVAYSGHNITVIDLEDWDIAYTVRTQGYPQTSALLTTAYSGEDDTVYVYFFDNYTPGKLRVLTDSPGQTEAMVTEVETYNLNGTLISYDTASVLFTPSGDQQQYAICSPISDEEGTIYFKNDSGYLMALGSTIESLEVTSLPDKTTYTVGETFDPTGMEVWAVLSNGVRRNVTDLVTYSTEALSQDDADFELRYEIVLYQNLDGEIGVSYSAPSVTISLTIGDEQEGPLYGDVNGDGVVDQQDAQAVISSSVGLLLLSEEQILLADVNGDGRITNLDAALILQYANKTISKFPIEE